MKWVTSAVRALLCDPKFRLMDPVHGPVYSELCPKLGMFDIDVAEVKPLDVPSALCFYMGYTQSKATKGG